MSILSLNKIALISCFSLCAFAGMYAEDPQNSEISASDDRRDYPTQNQQYQDQYRYNNYRYGNYGNYGGGYAQPAVVYPNSQYSAPYNPFPDSTRFNDNYERNSHPPR